MLAEVVLPELGLDPGETPILSVWFAQAGDLVYEGDRLVEVLIPGATFDVSSPATGRLKEVLAFPDDILRTGQVLGLVEPESDLEEEEGAADSTDVTG